MRCRPRSTTSYRNTANKLAEADDLRIWVMTDSDGSIIGFYAMNAHAVDYTDLPKRFARTCPGHGSIPAAYVSMIGVHKDLQGKGYGGDLLADCPKRIARVADRIGIAVVMLDVLDCGDPALIARRQRAYAAYGFEPLPSQPLRMFLPLATVRRMLDQAG